jgi:hypothetical protein
MSEPDGSGGKWTLLTGHGHVLVEIARNPEARIRDIAAVADITERTVQAIVADLEAAGYLTRIRAGRRTIYTVNPESLFRHPAQDGHRVGPFLALLSAYGDDAAPGPGGETSPDDPDGAATSLTRRSTGRFSRHPAWPPRRHPLRPVAPALPVPVRAGGEPLGYAGGGRSPGRASPCRRLPGRAACPPGGTTIHTPRG